MLQFLLHRFYKLMCHGLSKHILNIHLLSSSPITLSKKNSSITYIVTLICKLDGVKIVALLTFFLFLLKKKKFLKHQTKKNVKMIYYTLYTWCEISNINGNINLSFLIIKNDSIITWWYYSQFYTGNKLIILMAQVVLWPKTQLAENK